MKISRIGICGLLILLPLAVRAQTPPLSRVARGPGLVAQDQTLPSPEIVPLPGGGHTLRGALSLTDAEGLALANNPSLAKAAAFVDAARGRWVQAGLYPNPVIGYTGSEIGNEGRAGQQGGFIQQEFVTAGKLRLNREVAQRDIVVAQQGFAAQRFRVLNDVRIAFYLALISQRRLEVTRDLRDLGQKGLKTAEALFRGKEVSRADVLRAQIELDTTRNELSRAQANYLASWRTLAGVMGTPKMPPQHLIGEWENSWPEYDWHAALKRLLTESPLMAAALTRVERARWVLDREAVEPIPNVTVQASVQEDNATNDTITGVTASIPFPIFNRNQGNIQAARSELQAAERDVDRLALALQNQLAVAFGEFSAARQQAARYKSDILKNSKETLNLITTGYRQGEFKYTDVLSVQRTYFQAELTYLQAIQEARTAALRIDGLLLTGSLAN